MQTNILLNELIDKEAHCSMKNETAFVSGRTFLELQSLVCNYISSRSIKNIQVFNLLGFFIS